MIKAKTWKGIDLQGTWVVQRKLDGVRALVHRGRVVSRHGKPLYNLDRYASRFTDAEVWLGSFKATIQAVRSSTVKVNIPLFAVYSLDPPDSRLHLRVVENPTAPLIRALLKQYKRPGEDGLVLRSVVPTHLTSRGVQSTWLKVKHVDTYDVKVTGYKPGKGKHAGRMGALLTTMGKVGTGFSNAMRKHRSSWWNECTIEVKCNKLTADRKFRHARFIRVRPDK